MLPEVKIRLVNQDTKRIYETLTYAPGSVNSDDYYDENFVLGDLPAGPYRFTFENGSSSISTDIEIRPGCGDLPQLRSKGGFSTLRPFDKTQQFAMPQLVN